MERVELLAPARNIKAIKAGLPYADSFYVGSETLNMRMRADNFSNADLKQAVSLCHENDKQIFLTTNILVYEEELGLLRKQLEFAHSIDIDAAIVHDFAAIKIARDLNLPFHVSTQANISNSLSAQHFEELGAERLILARECSLDQIKAIKSKVHQAKIETFVHGAMCSSISGRCYFSQEVCKSVNDSANRGKCVQPCRREWRVYDDENNEFIYDGVRFLNSKDLCMLKHIPELIDAGVDAFKIEGRMRQPHYVDVVTSSYRKGIEAHYENRFTPQLAARLFAHVKKEYNRGFTTGFYFNRPTEDAQEHKRPSNLSHFRMIQMGLIEKYNEHSHKAIIRITNGKLRKGLDLIIQGNNDSNTYFHQRVDTFKYKGRIVTEAPKSQKNQSIEIELIMDEHVTPKKDEVYIFTNQTYKNRRNSRKRRSKKEYYRL